LARRARAESDGVTIRWSTLAWMWLGWTALAVFLGVSSSLAYLAVGNPPRWSLTIRMALAETYVWAAIAPLVVALARRFPFTRASLATSVPVHAVAAVVVSLIKIVIDQRIRQTLFGFRTYLLISSLAPSLLFYWAIVAAAHGAAYYRTSKERALRAAQLEARLAQSRLEVLQMQLHPHFLFNTLHTISELVHEDPETADAMIAGLSDLLREALASGHAREVPLARELDLLERYLDIQRVRFGERLQVDVDIAPSLATVLVPHLVLQPIVENALRHGIIPGATGTVAISAVVVHDMLRLCVQDDGRGFNASGDGEGVGLRNTRERLATLYGDRAGLRIAPAPAGGTIVEMLIPVRRQ
jgi:two-component system, LytTR family, sensor kinase